MGLSLFLGSKVSGHRTICHIAGEAQRMMAAAFQNEADKPGPLHALLLRYANALLF